MKTLALTVSTALVLAGCAVKPTAISDDAHAMRVAEDQRRLFDDQEAIKSPLTLHDAIARALRYNMDYRVRMMEEAAALGQTDLANFDLLPRLTASAGYTTRSSDAFGFGYTPSGTVTTTPSAATPRSHSYDSLSFSWNVLDFGASYLRAKQLADQSLIAEERRRKAVQNLVQDVRAAWWRAEAAQRLLPESDAILWELEQAGARAKLIESRKLLPPLQIVAYKRSLLDLEQQISMRRQDLAQAKLDLAQLLNLRPGQEFAVMSPQAEDTAPADLTANIEALEKIAVLNRPELREEGYRARITDLEANRQLLQLLPGLTLDSGTNHDSNKYLVNNTWTSAGLNLSWNLMKIASMPSLKRSSEALEKVDETRRQAMIVAVLGQTRIAAVRYRLLARELGIWDDAVTDDTRIVTYLSAGKQVGLETELELMRAKGRRMLSQVNRNLAHAAVQGAIGRLYNSLGLDSVSELAERNAPEGLAAALAEKIQRWESENFTAKPAVTFAPVAVMEVAGLEGANSEAFTTSLRRILTLSKLNTVGKEQSDAFRIQTAVALQPPGVSGQLATLSIRILTPQGIDVFHAEHNSMLVTPISLEQWRALGEGAGYRAIEPLRRLLVKATAAGRDAPKTGAAPVSLITNSPALAGGFIGRAGTREFAEISCADQCVGGPTLAQ